jgi:hypothetical protein
MAFSFFCAQNIKAVFKYLRDLSTASQIEISIFIGLIRNVINLKGSLEYVF